MAAGKYDVAAIRDQLKKANGKSSDPDEFKPAKAKPGEAINYRFFILPPIAAGTKLKSGIVEKDMDLFYIGHGAHWIDNRPHECPRLYDGTDCPICDFGFKLMKETSDKKKRQEIAKNWMPNGNNTVNIFFTNWDGNPPELRGQVKYFNAGKQVFDVWEACLMRDDAGDEDDPKAHGVFYDEYNAFVFDLEVTEQAGNNCYKTSKFLPKPQPMVRMKDGSPDEEKLAKLLYLRHNLWTKVAKPDMEAIKRIAKNKIDGDDDDGGGFDHDESKVESKPKSEPKAEAKTEPKAKTTVTSSKSTTAKSVEADDDVVDLMNESEPEAEIVQPKAKEAKAETKKGPPKTVDADDDDADIDAMLSQLGDDD